MKTEIYAIYDAKAKVYNKPFYQLNDDVALRTCSDLANDPQSELSKNPEDYTLFHLGTYDDENAQHDLNSAPKSMTNFAGLKL